MQSNSSRGSETVILDSTPVERPDFLEGLRGLASWMVVSCHLMLTFYPLYFSHEYSYFQSKTLLKKALAFSPLNVFINGHLAVMLFFIHSGLVLSFRFFTEENAESLIESSLRRYPRLAIPAVMSVLLAWILLAKGLMFSQQTYHLTGSNGWLKMNYGFESSFFKAVFQGILQNFSLTEVAFKASYNSSLWTIGTEMIGSYFVFAFLALFGLSHLRWLFYLASIALFYDTFYLAFILGTILCDLYVHQHPVLKKQKLGYILLGIGLYLGSVRVSEAPLFHWSLIFKDLNPYAGLYNPLIIFAAFLIVAAILILRPLQRILELRWIQFLGKISFSVYLLHIPLLCSLGCKMFNTLYLQYRVPYSVSAIISSGGLVIAVLVCAIGYRKWVDLPAIRFSKQLSKKVLKLEGAKVSLRSVSKLPNHSKKSILFGESLGPTR